MTCAICEIRKPKRFCPGVRGDICTICCGTEREQTIDCPIDCEYLREAHQHEKKPKVDLSIVPNQDIDITESFLDENHPLMMLLGSAAAESALEGAGVTDYDIREALESLIRTYRTLQSGLYYETRPQNPYAAMIHEAVQARVNELRQREIEERGSSTLRDASILGVLAFLQRFEYAENNGRKRSRAFLDFLSRLRIPAGVEQEGSLEPEGPRIIL